MQISWRNHPGLTQASSLQLFASRAAHLRGSLCYLRNLIKVPLAGIISSPEHEFAIGLDPELNLAQKFEVELWKNDDKMHQNKIYVVGGRVGTRKTKARWADSYRYPSISRRRTATLERTPVMPKEPGSLFTSTPSPGVALLKNGEWRYIFIRCRYYFKNEDASSLLRTNVRRRYNLSLRVTHTFWTCVFLCLFTKTPDDAKKKQRYNQDT